MTVYKTSLKPKDMASGLNSMKYVIDRVVKGMVNTILIVRVSAVHDNTIDVKTVIKDLSDSGQLVDTYTIPSVKYIKWQFGKNVLKAKPEVGDIGLLLISKQDTSGLVKDGESVCQTNSCYNIGDGIYLGGLEGLNEEATQFIEFKQDEVNITGTGTVKIVAPTVNIEATTANVNATAINLGGQGGKAVARQGDNVVAGTTVIGQIQAGSSKVFAVD